MKKLFRFIFGQPEEQIKSVDVSQRDDSRGIQEENAVVVEQGHLPEWEAVLIRYSRGNYDVLGKFYLEGHFECFTLEPIDPQKPYMEDLLPLGKYDLALRKEGGKHAAYFYRYQAMHRGMLWIQGSNQFPFALIHEGNSETDVPGSILIGELPVREEQHDQRREVWFSDQAYKKIYPKLADHLAGGGKVTLWIRQA